MNWYYTWSIKDREDSSVTLQRGIVKMVNESVERQLSYTLENVLTEKQLHHIVEKWMKDQDYESDVKWSLFKTVMKPAMKGIAGFLGDYLRVTLFVVINGVVNEIFLFVKSMPIENKPKADFIQENNFFRREMVMYRLFEEMGGSDGPDAWHPKAYICDETLVVMPDLVAECYTQRPPLETLDYEHILLTAASLARFHASFANYETGKSNNGSSFVVQEYGEIIAESNFKDTPWIRAAAKLTANFLEEFVAKYNHVPDLESKLVDLYIKACDSLIEYKNTVNVLIHKDVWVNNIMFKYGESRPSQALLIDFQCMRYGPPGFDVMIFLYMTTNNDFRRKYEKEVLSHYYTVFEETINDDTKARLQKINYNFEDFRKWCEVGRMFGILVATVGFPYILMEPLTAQKNFDDPETYMHYTNVDRTKPVVEHAYEVVPYKERILEVSEEFVERYVLSTYEI